MRFVAANAPADPKPGADATTWLLILSGFAIAYGLAYWALDGAADLSGPRRDRAAAAAQVLTFVLVTAAVAHAIWRIGRCAKPAQAVVGTAAASWVVCGSLVAWGAIDSVLNPSHALNHPASEFSNALAVHLALLLFAGWVAIVGTVALLAVGVRASRQRAA